MQSVILEANENFLKKAVALIKDLAQKENETINLDVENDGLSDEDLAKFKDTLDKYYKGELKFISFDELKSKIKARGL